ncbi:putative tRNA (pseudouridine(54)-N(1))-methyltransferase [Medicago truncatula]|uniref:EMG1/NEP1 methyltransferase n=2 Tax=Medicago truncatula TaxID=3880 RepID=A0A072UG33_MEDTR|nr:EMG1/NEP1 methyltransferase [Medicago truncatula]RHN56158.1 putative tRNA (pseudouridine(54)-N(1))-methyltransferase [Medicago truncatula]
MFSTQDQAVGNEEVDKSVAEIPGVYFIIENASFVVACLYKNYQILDSEEHVDFLRRKNMNFPDDHRPDIVHQALLAIMDSPLCLSGRVSAVFIRTDEGILIKVDPQGRIPETFGKFCNMMSELLQKSSIKSKGNEGRLFELIQNPVTQHLPVNSLKIGLSFNSPKAVKINDFVAANCDNHKSLVFVVDAMAHGKVDAMAHGKVDADYIDDFISVSGYPPNADTCLYRICDALESYWKIF